LISPLSLGLSAAEKYTGSGFTTRIYDQFDDHPTACSLEAEKRILSDRAQLSFMMELRAYVTQNNQALSLKKTLVAWYGNDYEKYLSEAFKNALVYDYGSSNLDQRESAKKLSCAFQNTKNSSNDTIEKLAAEVLSNETKEITDQLKKLSKLLIDACGEDTIHIDPNLKLGTYWGSPSRSDISYLLNEKNAQPVVIEYCANFIQKNGNANFVGVSDAQNCAGHESVVIGQRMNDDGECEFLLRNSWGNDWCPPDLPFVSECEKGQIWISADRLDSQIYGFQTFSQTQKPYFLEDKLKPSK
jgi:hypothetical protein